MEFKGNARDITNKKNTIYEKILATDNSNIINLSHLSSWESNIEKASEYFCLNQGFQLAVCLYLALFDRVVALPLEHPNLLKHTHPSVGHGPVTPASSGVGG